MALSLGLVGALSIVRFRAAIKDPEELVYLFLIISIGLASGANQYKIAIFGTLIALLILFIYHSFSKKTKVSNTKEFFNFSIVSEKKLNKSELIKLISPYCDMVDFVSITENNSRSILNLRIGWNHFKYWKIDWLNWKKFSNTELIYRNFKFIVVIKLIIFSKSKNKKVKSPRGWLLSFLSVYFLLSISFFFLFFVFIITSEFFTLKKKEIFWKIYKRGRIEYLCPKNFFWIFEIQFYSNSELRHKISPERQLIIENERVKLVEFYDKYRSKPGITHYEANVLLDSNQKKNIRANLL